MSYEWIASLCKSVSLVIFFSVFCGFAFYAYRKGNKEKLEAYASLPLKED